jgi:signal transduction histidine kinase
MNDHMDANPDLPWSRVAAFIRQHTHDVRNHLNALELEASLMGDFVQDPEAVECLGRIRSQLRGLAANLRALSGKFQDPKVAAGPIAASELFEIWKEQWSALEERPQVEWKNELDAQSVEVDAASIAAVFSELLNNAKAFGTGETLVALARAEGGQAVFELREPKREVVEPATWGRSPLASTRRHGYGLGLWEADRVVKANGGSVSRCYDPGQRCLVTTIVFPAAR